MPTRAPRVCALCGGVHADGERCPKAVGRDRERKARFDEKRPTARERGYDSKWDKARASYLKSHPVCARCGAPATIVDHVKPHRGDNHLFWDKTNWQPLCVTCHSVHKQSAERKQK